MWHLFISLRWRPLCTSPLHIKWWIWRGVYLRCVEEDRCVGRIWAVTLSDLPTQPTKCHVKDWGLSVLIQIQIWIHLQKQIFFGNYIIWADHPAHQIWLLFCLKISFGCLLLCIMCSLFVVCCLLLCTMFLYQCVVWRIWKCQLERKKVSVLLEQLEKGATGIQGRKKLTNTNTSTNTNTNTSTNTNTKELLKTRGRRQTESRLKAG